MIHSKNNQIRENCDLVTFEETEKKQDDASLANQLYISSYNDLMIVTKAIYLETVVFNFVHIHIATDGIIG